MFTKSEAVWKWMFYFSGFVFAVMFGVSVVSIVRAQVDPIVDLPVVPIEPVVKLDRDAISIVASTSVDSTSAVLIASGDKRNAELVSILKSIDFSLKQIEINTRK